jgi:hypothetical protein
MSTSSCSDREAVRLELREIEDIADEALEPHALACDHLERRCADVRVFGHAFSQSVDVPADRRQRRAQLVRDGHEEVPLLLFGKRQTGGHLREAVREMSDLAAAPDLGHVDVVVAARDLVCRRRERENRPADPADRYHASKPATRMPPTNASARRLTRGVSLLVISRLRRRDDESTERRALRRQPQRPLHGEVRRA